MKERIKGRKLLPPVSGVRHGDGSSFRLRRHEPVPDHGAGNRNGSGFRDRGYDRHHHGRDSGRRGRDRGRGEQPEEAAAAEPETEKYQPVDETVVVKADLLNVRKEDRPTPGSTSS